MREEMLIRELTPYGKDLKCQLVRLGMTQVELAGKVGTSKQYLGKILFGERTGTLYLDQIDQELLTSQKTKRQNTLTSYGKEVKCRLIELNMTQVQLAEMAGTTKQYLGKILHGTRSGAMYMESINRILGLEMETSKHSKTGKTSRNDKSLKMAMR
ncbi:helix-turn-helix transcriptional regulator [[Clostridium] polysaccharolyticum]|uniref:Helix-turn-helix n=1 Tax=[Clostridium] polysaccharolyticum TaxID=29364 RepID=A0A1I0CC58_9FIRM|nr:helix-turn-helix transcriptional regulator [[Clostridium] polysaccharolyticum]SET16944.1 Helix-turn-helix [[Clostridium] polysaccharolyticum]